MNRVTDAERLPDVSPDKRRYWTSETGPDPNVRLGDLSGVRNERTAQAGGSLRALNMDQAAVVLLAGGWNGSS